MAPTTGQASTRRQPPAPPPPLPPAAAAAAADDDDHLDFSVFLDAPPAVPVPAVRPTTTTPTPFAPSFQSPFPPPQAQAPFVPGPVVAAAAAPQQPRAFAAPQASYPPYHTLQRMRPARTPFAGLQTVFRVETPTSRNLPQPSQQLQPPVSTHPGLQNGGSSSRSGRKNNSSSRNHNGNNDDDDDDDDDDNDDNDNDDNDNDNDDDGHVDAAGNPDPIAQLSGSPYFPGPAAAAAAAALNHPDAAPDDPANPWVELANAVFADPGAGIESVRSAAATSGFGVVKSRSARRHQTVRQRQAGEQGEVYRIDLECTSASPRDKRAAAATTKGARPSRRRGCKWKATLVQKVIRSNEIGGVDRKFWRFEQKPRAHVHNHPLAVNAAEIPVNRRRAVESARDQIFALRGQPKATPQRIADYINEHNPGFAITATDIKNLFYKETRILRKQQREAERSATAE